MKKVPKSVDPYWNVTEWEEVRADEYPIYEGKDKIKHDNID